MSTKRRAYLTEMKTQLTLAVPALLAQIAMISMGFVDMVMTGRVGAVDMAAVALAGSLWVPLVLFGQGLLLAVTPCVAQLRGAGSMRSGEHMQGVGHVMRQGIWMALFISVPLILIVYLVSFHLADMGVEGALGLHDGAVPAGDHLGRSCLPAVRGFALRHGGDGAYASGHVRGLYGAAHQYTVQLYPDFRQARPPGARRAGYGVATAIVYWVMFLTMVVYVCRHTYLRELMTWRVWEIPVWATLKKLAGIGFPGALAMLFEVTLFAAVALLIAPLGAIQVAGHQVALNFSSLLFMVPLSIGTAATIRTGFALGRKSVEAVRVASRSSWLLACMAACFTALVTILWRHQIAAVYNNDPVVLGLASHLLLFAATYQITDAVQVVSVGILRGYNDTRAILCVTLISYWVFALPVGYTLGRTHLWGDPLGPQGFWTAFIVGVSIAAVLLVIRVRVLERRLLSGFDRIRVMEG